MDTLDGRYSRMSGKGTLFGAFLDSTLDRVEEGIVLAAVAGYFAATRRRLRRGDVRRRRARLADGLLHPRPGRGARGRVQGRARATRPVRVVILSIGLVFAKGAGDRRLRAARARHLRDGRADRPSPSSSASGTCGASSAARRGRRTRPDRSCERVTAGPGCHLPSRARSRRTSYVMSETQRSNGGNGSAPAGRQGPRRDRRRRQLRQLLHPGRRVLQGRRPGRGRAGPDARRPRRLPRQRHRVRRRLRHRLREGRQGPLRGDLVGPERHDQVRRRARTSGSRSSAA